MLDELLELRRVVAAGEDAGVDRGMEGLDLAADERRDAGSGRRRARPRCRRSARCSRVPSVAKSSTPRPSSSRAKRRETVAVRDREQGSHAACLRPRLGRAVRRSTRGASIASGAAPRDRRSGRPGGPRAFPGGEYSVPPWHTRPAHRARVARPPSTRRASASRDEPDWENRETRALGIPVHSLQQLNFPDLFNPIWIGVARPAASRWSILYNVRTRQLHRHAPLRRDVRVAAVDRRDRLRAGLVDVRAVRLRLPVRGGRHSDHPRRRSSGSGSSASRRSSRRTSRSSRASATSRGRSSRTPRARSGRRSSGAGAAADARRTRRPTRRADGDRAVRGRPPAARRGPPGRGT